MAEAEQRRQKGGPNRAWSWYVGSWDVGMTKDLGGRGQALLCIIDGEKMPRGYALHPHPCAAIGSMRLPSCVCVFLGGTGVTRVLLFSEPGCSGEEITLTGGGDLCDLNFPSGTGVKDNVASVSCH